MPAGLESFGFAEVDVNKKGLPEYSLGQVCPAEICLADVCPAEGGPAEDGVGEHNYTEVRPVEVRAAEIYLLVSMCGCPCIPDLDPALEDGELLLIGHSLIPPCVPRPGQGICWCSGYVHAHLADSR
jgi:hypothetical protein